MKIVILLKENWSYITKSWIFLNGNDVDENRHFIEGKLVAHYQILNAMLMKIVILWNFEYFSIGAMLLKIVILLMEKWSHMDKIFNRDMLMKIVILWKKLVAHGYISWIWFDRRTMREEMTILKKETTYGGVQTFFHGGDVHENHHFIGGKLIAHGQILISKYYLLMINFVFN